MSTTATMPGVPKRIRKRRPLPGQEFESVSFTLPKPQVDHLRVVARETGKPMAEQVTEAVAAQTGIGRDYLKDN